VELECRQIWWSPGVWEVKVKRPSEPYCRDSTTYARVKASSVRRHRPARSCPWGLDRAPRSIRQRPYLAIGVFHLHVHAQAGGRGQEHLLLLVPHLSSVVACGAHTQSRPGPHPPPTCGPGSWAEGLASSGRTQARFGGDDLARLGRRGVGEGPGKNKGPLHPQPA
jgi:hypothetical protein